MTPTVIQRLRCTLRDLWHYDGCGCNTCVPVAEVIAAIEQALTAKDAEIAELRKAFKRYAQHTSRCTNPPSPCSCGFDDASDALAKKARAEAPK